MQSLAARVSFCVRVIQVRALEVIQVAIRETKRAHHGGAEQQSATRTRNCNNEAHCGNLLSAPLRFVRAAHNENRAKFRACRRVASPNRISNDELARRSERDRLVVRRRMTLSPTDGTCMSLWYNVCMYYYTYVTAYVHMYMYILYYTCVPT